MGHFSDWWKETVALTQELPDPFGAAVLICGEQVYKVRHLDSLQSAKGHDCIQYFVFPVTRVVRLRRVLISFLKPNAKFTEEQGSTETAKRSTCRVSSGHHA